MSANIWTDDKIAELRRRWTAGESGTTIAKALGWRFTRNSVIAKARRLGLEERTPVVRR